MYCFIRNKHKALSQVNQSRSKIKHSPFKLFSYYHYKSIVCLFIKSKRMASNKQHFYSLIKLIDCYDDVPKKRCFMLSFLFT